MKKKENQYLLTEKAPFMRQHEDLMAAYKNLETDIND